MCCFIHILAWIYRSFFAIRKSLVLDGLLHYVNCVPCAAILQIFLLFSTNWYCRIQSPAVSKQRDEWWCGFRWRFRYELTIFESVDMSNSTPSCSYCIWNRYFQNRRSILPSFLFLSWFDTVKFNRRSCSNNKVYDDVVFGDRFRYQLTMFKVCILIGLSRLLDTHISCQIAL